MFFFLLIIQQRSASKRNIKMNNSNKTGIDLASMVMKEAFNQSITVYNETVGNPVGQSNEEFILPWWQQMIWILIFAAMVIVATGGNLIVIWLVLSNQRMRNVTNFFIVNLSLADIMVSTLNVVPSFIGMLNEWPFGALYCKISNFIAILSVSASVFTLMAISIDRYIAIVHPLQPRMTKTTVVVIILVIWCGSSLLSSPNYVFSTTVLESYANGDKRVICYMVWPDGISNSSYSEHIYNIIIFLVTYMVPMISMSYTYFCVGRVLWGSQGIGESVARQLESIKSKKKIVKMMIVVIIIFAVCWLPYHIYFLMIHHFPDFMTVPYVQHVYFVIYWLAMSNSMYNPLIYCWMNKKFRKGFLSVFHCICLRNHVTQRLHEARYNGQSRYSCSEAGLTDTKVRYNENGISMHTLTEPLNSSNDSFRNKSYKSPKFRMEML